MLFKARDAFDLDMRRSAIVGDRETDIQAGINGGVGTRILVEGVKTIRRQAGPTRWCARLVKRVCVACRA